MKREGLLGKIVAFILVIISVGVIILTSIQAIYIIDNNLYGKGKNDINTTLKYNLTNQYAQDVIEYVLWSGYSEYEINDSGVLGAKLVKKVYENFADGNLDNKKSDKIETVWKYGEIDKFKEPVEKYVAKEVFYDDDGHNLSKYDVVLYLSTKVEPDSNVYIYNKLGSWLYKTKNIIYPIGIISFVIGISSLIYLLYAVGHKKDTNRIIGSFVTKIPVDIYTLLTGIVGFCSIGAGLMIVDGIQSINSSIIMIAATIVCIYLICGFISLLWLVDMAVRIKMGKWWQNSVIYKLVNFVVKNIIRVIEKVPLIWKTVICFGIVSICEFFVILIFSWDISGGLLVLWFMEKIVLFAAVMAVSLIMRKLKIAGKKISMGDLEYQVDTKYMFMDFKEHAENLNEIGQGLNSAVDEKLKSERMKTELITNVSHDIKTPLTSIINYSDLIGKELEVVDENSELATNINMEKIKEYIEVLNRQSARLKRLIEDLVEASKASTGNLDINLEPMEIGVMLAQIEGEYEEKLIANELNLIVNKPDEPTYIMADGRRMWRVMDNLLNNICKYALPGTRVYLNLEKKEDVGKAVITLKNISKYPLNLSPDELLERFVQGDKARNTEGSGLGLSIANSLTGLQNGNLELKADGDLFKAILTFPLIRGTASTGEKINQMEANKEKNENKEVKRILKGKKLRKNKNVSKLSH